MADLEQVKQMALESGFSHVADLDVSTIELRTEVRAACEKNTCRQYGKNWACPPGCGTLEECDERIKKYHHGIIFQTTGEIDTMDFEAIAEFGVEHAKHVEAFAKLARANFPGCMLIGDGSCNTCKECTYPDAPCRFPDKLTSSMEGLGMIVSDVCKSNNIPYYYGPGTLTYVGCLLVD